MTTPDYDRARARLETLVRAEDPERWQDALEDFEAAVRRNQRQRDITLIEETHVLGSPVDAEFASRPVEHVVRQALQQGLTLGADRLRKAGTR